MICSYHIILSNIINKELLNTTSWINLSDIRSHKLKQTVKSTDRL